MILELKYHHSAQEAFRQIKDKNNIQQVEQCKEILLVGISYDEEKRHSC